MSDDPTSPDYYDDMPSALDIFERNKEYAKEEAAGYQTKLNPQQEKRFKNWVKENKVPFDPADPTPDYDMRGFYKALRLGDAKAKSAISETDNQIHYPDYWKTPYHMSFSAESRWAKDGAPSWNDKDQLITPSGRIIFDERALVQSRNRRNAQ